MYAELKDLDIPVLSYSELVLAKKFSNRPKDRDDLEGLRRARGEE